MLPFAVLCGGLERLLGLDCKSDLHAGPLFACIACKPIHCCDAQWQASGMVHIRSSSATNNSICTIRTIALIQTQCCDYHGLLHGNGRSSVYKALQLLAIKLYSSGSFSHVQLYLWMNA